ncbi:MAG: FMN-binding negative transcriptional regulator [Methylococcaceae bacterium]|nr:FMN-binding negative transcriptional regulator [Methylococcaceae bacterium]MDP2394104.1 FMN-binding negative transcriptional regulator [Methylococcaceae bacterium]MDP3019694.1 FMN-binding negative transcriptional regulator [Methylococcaceae bacterium]MDP3389972.1 FMN-binding negative transcriptional regulator [Methylococcaceae bacterium]MDP3933637.1 FMN-binding negative transcriptional regulator [Methylococcaceae bacterium]
MYIPKPFDEPRIDVMQALIRDYPLATLVTLSADGLNANHIPLHLVVDGGSPFGTLRGHVVRSNPMWGDFDQQTEILTVFQAANAYISPSRYVTKQQTGKVVPTWNYAAVHAYGTMRVIDDAAWIRNQLETLTAEHEAAFPKPWAVSDAPHDFTEKLIEQIIGIEITVTRLSGKWKVSQNQPAENQIGVINGLNECGKVEAAALIKTCQKP